MLPFLFFVSMVITTPCNRPQKATCLFSLFPTATLQTAEVSFIAYQVFLKPCLIRRTLERLSFWSNVTCWWHAHKAGRAAMQQSLQRAGGGVTSYLKQCTAPSKGKQVSPLERFWWTQGETCCSDNFKPCGEQNCSYPTSPRSLVLIFVILEWLYFGTFFSLKNWGSLNLKFGRISSERWLIFEKA